MERRTFDFRSPYRVLPQECDRCPVKPIGEGKTPDALAHSIAGRVESLCRSHRLFETGAQAAVMVSGGQDSVALLTCWPGGRLGIYRRGGGRINHHLRGRRATPIRRLWSACAGNLEWSWWWITVRWPNSRGIAGAGSELRRAAACEVAARLSLSRVALGHTMDDQVETMLYRLGKYGGLRSLRAMEVRRGPWVRPLLSLRRSDTEAYCLAHGLRFATDRGNQYPGYVRTGIREVVLPAWERVVPGAVEAASRAAGVAVEAVEVLRAEARAFEEACRRGPGVWSVSRLRSVPEDKRRMVLYELLAGCLGVELTRDHVASLESLLVVHLVSL